MRERYLLVVDDEPNIIQALKRELHDWAAKRSLTIVGAESGKEAIAILEKAGKDTVLIVSDQKMPEMNGCEFLAEVKRLYPEIITLLLTGYAETADVVKAVGVGVFRYLLKPWDPECLAAELTKAFDFAESRNRNKQYRKLIEDELKYAGELQRAVLRPNLPTSEGVEFKASYRPLPAFGIGGDYYDVIYLGQRKYLVLIGDVAGHGVRAAIVTAILKAVIYPEYVRNAIGRDFSPAAFLEWLNERMNFELRSASDLVITFFAGVLDVSSATFRYANAGHNHPFLVRSGKAADLPVSGSALGFARSVHYIEKSVDILPYDLLVFFSDGLVENGGARSDCGENGNDVKLGPLLEKMEYGTGYHRQILDRALSASGRTEFSDDVTIISAKIG